MRDGITAAVQPTLDFLNGYFKSAADGSLQITRDVAMQALSVAKLATFNAGLRVLNDLNIVNGNLTVKTRTGNGVVIVPAGGTPAFYITNPAGNQALFLVYADGTFYCQGANSANGFKTITKVGSYWNTAPGANATFSFGDTVQNVQNATMGFTPYYEKMTHSGSIVGISVNEAGPNVAAKTIYIYKNNSELFRWVTGANGNNATFWTAYNKGQYTFAQGDTLNVYGSVGSTANTQLSCYLTLEMSA